MKRLFLGVSVPNKFINQIGAYVSTYKTDQHFKDAKWTKPEDAHISVFFLGELPSAHLSEITTIIRGVAGRMAPFTLHFERIEFFAHKMPKMIWARFQRNLGFLELNQEAKKFLKPYIEMTEEEELKEPIPHITIARLRTPVDPKKFSFKPFSMNSLEVTHLNLYESEENSSGRHYTILDTFSLGLS